MAAYLTVAMLLHYVHLPGNSPKIICHLSASTTKEQSPQDNNEAAFKWVLQCTYEQTTPSCKVQLCIKMHTMGPKNGRNGYINQYGYITPAFSGPHGGERSIWLHHPCVLGVSENG